MKDLIGRSPAIQRIRRKTRQLSKSTKNVLLSGERGVGKGLVAESIHLQGHHAAKPYAMLNISTIDELKLRSMVQKLIEKREFSNPVTSEHGNFQLPDGAALILEDIDKASFAGQGILLDLLAGCKKGKLYLRFMMLFNKSLKEGLKDRVILPALGKEVRRWDHVHIPALRDRREDIPELVEHFVEEAGRQHGIKEVVIDINAIGVLVRREWGGNVQELKSFVEQTMLLSEDKEIFRLPEEMVDEHSELTTMLEKIEGGVDFAIDNSMEIIEKRILERVLVKFGFNQSRAAKFLRIREDTLRYRMKKLGIASSQKT